MHELDTGFQCEKRGVHSEGKMLMAFFSKA